MIFKKDNKIFGELTQGVFSKSVDSKKHKMKIGNMYGVEESVVQEMQQLGCDEIRILEKDTGTLFSVPFQDFLENSTVKTFGGYAPQRFISCSKMKVLTPVDN